MLRAYRCRKSGERPMLRAKLEDHGPPEHPDQKRRGSNLCLIRHNKAQREENNIKGCSGAFDRTIWDPPLLGKGSTPTSFRALTWPCVLIGFPKRLKI